MQPPSPATARQSSLVRRPLEELIAQGVERPGVSDQRIVFGHRDDRFYIAVLVLTPTTGERLFRSGAECPEPPGNAGDVSTGWIRRSLNQTKGIPVEFFHDPGVRSARPGQRRFSGQTGIQHSFPRSLQRVGARAAKEAPDSLLDMQPGVGRGDAHEVHALLGTGSPV